MTLLEKCWFPLASGAFVTLQVFFVTLILSLPLALILVVIYQFNHKSINWMMRSYITIERGTPLLLQMMFIYFGLPYMEITFNRETSILIAFVLNYTAYFIEILRGGIHSVDQGQFEACQVLGYSKFATYRKVILPQAISCCFPSIANEVLTLIKDTSLITVLGASELLKAGRSAVVTYATAIPFIYVGIIYLLLISMTEMVLKRIENKTNTFI